MPSGVILTSASPGATEEKVAHALASAGLEVETPEVPAIEGEPKRDDFQTAEEFDAAVEEFNAAHPEETEEEHEEEQAPARKPSKFQKRIQKITGRLESENAELRERLAKLEKGGKTAEEETPSAEVKRPVRADFKSNEEYEDALLAWGTDRRLLERQQREAVETAKAEAQENYDAYKEGVDEFVAEHDDWNEVVNQDIPIHPDVQYAIFELREAGAAVTYYLGTHPEYAVKLAKMPVRSAVMEVGRLSTKLTPESGSGRPAAGSGAPPKPRPRIPPPVRTVNTSTTSQSLTSAEAAKNKNYKAFKAAQRSGR